MPRGELGEGKELGSVIDGGVTCVQVRHTGYATPAINKLPGLVT